MLILFGFLGIPPVSPIRKAGETGETEEGLSLWCASAPSRRWSDARRTPNARERHRTRCLNASLARTDEQLAAIARLSVGSLPVANFYTHTILVGFVELSREPTAGDIAAGAPPPSRTT